MCYLHFPSSLVNLCSLSLKDGNVQNQVTKNCVLTDHPLQNLFSLEYEHKMFTVFTELWNENFSPIHQLKNWKSPLHCAQKLNMFHTGISLKIKIVRERSHFGRYSIYLSIIQQKKNIPLHVPKNVSYSHDNLHFSTGHSLAAAASTPPSAPSGFALMLQLHHTFEQIWNSVSSASMSSQFTCPIRNLKGSVLPCLLYIVANDIHLLNHWIFWIKHLGSLWAPARIRHNLQNKQCS